MHFPTMVEWRGADHRRPHCSVVQVLMNKCSCVQEHNQRLALSSLHPLLLSQILLLEWI